jgi:hypothetical protein
LAISVSTRAKLNGISKVSADISPWWRNSRVYGSFVDQDWGQNAFIQQIAEYAAGALCPLIVSPDVGDILLLRGHLSPERPHDVAIRPFDRVDWRDLAAH